MTEEIDDPDPFVEVRLKGTDSATISGFLKLLHGVGIVTIEAEKGVTLATRVGEDVLVPSSELAARIMGGEVFLPLDVPRLGILRRFSSWRTTEDGNTLFRLDFEGLTAAEKIALLKLVIAALPSPETIADFQARLHHQRWWSL